MIDSIVLTEYEDWRGLLDDADMKFVAGQLSHYLSFRVEVHDGRLCYILNPRQFAGVAVLPSGRRIECHPKVPVRSLLYMLSVAYDVPDLLLQHTELDLLDQLLPFIVHYFADLVSARIARGLYRSYVEAEDNLSVVRGRIDFTEDIHRNYILRHRTYCRFTEFTWDIPENQILRQVVRLLRGWDFYPELRRRLAQIGASLSDLTPTAFRSDTVGTFHYDRFNDDYRPLHQLCRLFLDAESLSERAGSYDFPAFLIDMNRLFETFITRVLGRGAPASLVIEAQPTKTLDCGDAVEVRPDLVFNRNRHAVLVADCKYKRVEPDQYQHPDIYQLLAYCTRWRVTRGALIYPKHIESAELALHIRNSPIAIRRFTIDLGREPEDLDQECARLRNVLVAWSVTP